MSLETTLVVLGISALAILTRHLIAKSKESQLKKVIADQLSELEAFRRKALAEQLKELAKGVDDAKEKLNRADANYRSIKPKSSADN